MARTRTSGVVHQNVELAVSLFRFGEKPRNVRLFRDVSLYRNCLAAIGRDFLYNAVCALFARGVVHHNGRALGGECLGDVRADSFEAPVTTAT